MIIKFYATLQIILPDRWWRYKIIKITLFTFTMPRDVREIMRLAKGNHVSARVEVDTVHIRVRIKFVIMKPQKKHYRPIPYYRISLILKGFSIISDKVAHRTANDWTTRWDIMMYMDARSQLQQHEIFGMPREQCVDREQFWRANNSLFRWRHFDDVSRQPIQ